MPHDRLRTLARRVADRDHVAYTSALRRLRTAAAAPETVNVCFRCGSKGGRGRLRLLDVRVSPHPTTGADRPLWFYACPLCGQGHAASLTGKVPVLLPSPWSGPVGRKLTDAEADRYPVSVLVLLADAAFDDPVGQMWDDPADPPTGLDSICGHRMDRCGGCGTCMTCDACYCAEE
ncbi:hypothetical protein [Nocardiopsis sp. FIRDI 009]|uniref:hypothetical protein n=1 Tax=Nocardiopsis sp. FIRDI 009 TaxID=714197 RepID=UPI000E26FFCF|nr:hypothetical protein [Nocardiopsis sp. FIRDI 009]